MRRLTAPSSMALPLWAALSVLFSTLQAQSSDNWVLRGEKDDVQVYYRQTSDVHEIKLVTTIRTSLAGIVQLFDDVPSYPQWGYHLMEARLVKRVSETEMYYYSRFDFPWPLSDRDLIMHTQLKQDPNTRTVTSVSVAVPDMLPEVEGVVRIRKAHSKWVICPAKPGVLNVEYYLYSHPGGQLPGWLINMAVDIGPRESIKKMRALLLDPTYRNARLAHVRE